MTTNDPILHTKLISGSKGSTIQTNSKRKEFKRVNGHRLNQKRTEIRSPNKPTHLSPIHHDAKHPHCQKKAAGPRMDGKNRFRKLQREQNSTNETTNATKLDETGQKSTTTTNGQNETALILHYS